MITFDTKGPLARTDIPDPMPFLPGLKALAAWIEAAIEGDRS